MLATSTWYCCIALEKGCHGASDSRCSRCRASAKVWGSCDGLASSKPEGNHFQKCIAKVIPEMTMMLVSLTLTWMAPENGWLSPKLLSFWGKRPFFNGRNCSFQDVSDSFDSLCLLGPGPWICLVVVSCQPFEMVPSRPDFGEGASTTWRQSYPKKKTLQKDANPHKSDAENQRNNNN